MKKAFVLVILFIILLTLTNAFAETLVSGNITANTTWMLANSPYIVTGTIQVYPEATLTIDPGVEVRFNEQVGLAIGGGLVAIGEENKMIKFTSNKMQPAAGDWDAIEIMQSTVDLVLDDNCNYISGNIVKYCTIEYSLHGISSDESSLYISNSNIHDNLHNAIVTDDTAYNSSRKIIIDSNTLTNNNNNNLNCGGYSLYLIKNNRIVNDYPGGASGSAILLTSNNMCIFEGNHVEGLSDITLKWQLKINHNTFANNWGQSVLFNIGGTGGNVEMYYCTITSNRTTTLDGDKIAGSIFQCEGGAKIQYNNIYANESDILINNRSAETINAQNNWWGTTDTAVIDQKISDYQDDFTKGNVLYEPIATELIPPNIDAGNGISDACETLNTTTSTTSTTTTISHTTTTVPPSICPLVQSVSNTNHLNTLRELRDIRLNNNALNLVSLYYANATEVSRILADNPLMKKRLNDLVVTNMCIAEEIILKKSATAQKNVIDDVADYLIELKTHGSPKLQADIDSVIKGIEEKYLLKGIGLNIK